MSNAEQGDAYSLSAIPQESTEKAEFSRHKLSHRDRTTREDKTWYLQRIFTTGDRESKQLSQ